ncbi:MAG: TonB family protein [Thiobacillus sp.]|nr:TonB family protein [Thiobacillus sp.]
MKRIPPRRQSEIPHLPPGLLAGVAFAHVGLLAALLYSPRFVEPVMLPHPLTVSLIVPEIEEPQAKPEPRPQPPRPQIKPLPPPPVLVAERPLPAPQPVIEAPKPTPMPEPVPEVLPPLAPVLIAPKPAPSTPPPPIPPRPADYLNNPRPPYPPLSRRQGEQGTVHLNILVNPDGSVARLELLKSSGHPRLDKSAIETVQSSWKFEPARQGGNPVAAWVIVPIQFTLRS